MVTNFVFFRFLLHFILRYYNNNKFWQTTNDIMHNRRSRYLSMCRWYKRTLWPCWNLSLSSPISVHTFNSKLPLITYTMYINNKYLERTRSFHRQRRLIKSRGLRKRCRKQVLFIQNILSNSKLISSSSNFLWYNYVRARENFHTNFFWKW